MLLQAKDVGFLAIRALPEVVEWKAAPVRRLWWDVLGRCSSWHGRGRRALCWTRLDGGGGTQLQRPTKKHREVNDYTSANRRCIGALGRAQVLGQREEEQPPEPQLCAELGEALSLRGLLLTLRAAALGVSAAPRACATQ